MKSFKSSEVGVIPTDTIYGIVGSALIPDTVERIYKLKKRAPDKPMIILIFSVDNLQLFGLQPRGLQRKLLENIWPNPVSVILPCLDNKFKYLHRGAKTLAFRMPDKKDLLNLLKQTGPLVAPSANFEGEEPAKTIAEAKKYFGERVDFYIDGGKLDSKPSTLVEIKNGKVNVLRS